MLKTCMCAIGVMFKRNLELHIVRPKPNLLSSCSQSCTTLLEEAVTKSSNGTQLTITNLPTNIETISNTQHTNSLAVTNKENISNKSGHSTATL